MMASVQGRWRSSSALRKGRKHRANTFFRPQSTDSNSSRQPVPGNLYLLGRLRRRRLIDADAFVNCRHACKSCPGGGRHPAARGNRYVLRRTHRKPDQHGHVEFLSFLGSNREQFRTRHQRCHWHGDHFRQHRRSVGRHRRNCESSLGLDRGYSSRAIAPGQWHAAIYGDRHLQ
jgi:hypothetical protein